jgi:glutathione S-transferase
MPTTPKLSLYYYPTCWACRRVLRALDSLGMDVELRQIRENPDYRDELIAARGRKRVPVLRVDHADGRTEWIPESRVIVQLLQAMDRASG